MSLPLLQVKGLKVELTARRGGQKKVLQAVRGVDLDVGVHETVGLVGESGSGKSTTARAILGLVQPSAGSIFLNGKSLTQDSEARVRSAGVLQAVFQDPLAALDPRLTVLDSIAEPMRKHMGFNRAQCTARVRELLAMVNLPTRLAFSYPRDLSGGQRQRVNIARAIATEPELVVLDEPLSALDMSTQSHVFNLLESLRQDLGISYLFIAHDLAIVNHASARIAVMYLGSIVEIGDSDTVYKKPMHPYSKALVASAPVANPSLQLARRQERRQLIKGDLPSPFSPPSGCAYHPRCPLAFGRCKSEVPDLREAGDGRKVACHLY